GDDAAGGALGTIADAERSAGNFADEDRFAERAASLKVLEVGPRKRGAPGFVRGDPADGDEALLMRDAGVGTQKDSFDPTEDGGVGADSQREAKDGQRGKARAAAEHAEAD